MELRSRSTTIIGERFYLYAAKAKAIPPVPPCPIWSDDLRVATPPPSIAFAANSIASATKPLPWYARCRGGDLPILCLR